MLTIQFDDFSEVRLATLKAGELFAYSGSEGDSIGVVAENMDREYLIWLQLTGKNRFLLRSLQGINVGLSAPRVLRLGIQWADLKLQIDEKAIKRAGIDPGIGCLLVDGHHPRIVTKFQQSNEAALDDIWAISLRDWSRDRVGNGNYYCNSWRLIRVQDGTPPEVVAEFSPLPKAAVEPLRI